MSSLYYNQSANEKVFYPIQQKTFHNILMNFFRLNCPQFGGDVLLKLLADKLIELIEKYYPAPKHFKMGQLLWFGVAEDETPGKHQSMSQTNIVPVILTLVHSDDIQALTHSTPRHIISQNILARIYREAKEQGAVLAESDVALIRNLSLHTISKQTRCYEKSHNTILPRRGTVHDLGNSVSHKKIICKKHFVDKKSFSQIAQETFHSTGSISRYVNDFNRILFCLSKGLTVDDIPFATKISKNVVNQYVELFTEIYDEIEIPF